MKNHYVKCSRQWRERKTCKLHFRHLKIVIFQKRMIAPPNVQYHARGRMMADPMSQKSRKICVNHRKKEKLQMTKMGVSNSSENCSNFHQKNIKSLWIIKESLLLLLLLSKHLSFWNFALPGRRFLRKSSLN